MNITFAYDSFVSQREYFYATSDCGSVILLNMHF